jgi:hypothetical protein
MLVVLTYLHHKRKLGEYVTVGGAFYLNLRKEKIMTRKSSLLLLVTLALIACPLFALAGGTVTTGTINGLSCYINEATCPVDKLDPHVALETAFVLGIDADKYYLLPNVPRNILENLVNSQVRVTGKTINKYNSINVAKLEVKKGGSWKVVWSLKMQEEIQRQMSVGP